jgi:hypothetical protein
MKSSTITEGFLEAIGGRRVERAFFSTFCLEPDFFELEVLPLLLGARVLSTSEPIRYQQLQSLMGASRGCFGVAYDAPVFTPTLAPRLEVDYLPLQVDGACHHAKLAIIEVAGKENERALILCAGSFNLTKAGWWENIEVGHWVELNAADAPRNILLPLREAIDYYLAQGDLPVLRELQALVSGWAPKPDHPDCTFYFSGPGRRGFADFLRPVARSAVEIISPYFAEEGSNPKVGRFLKKFDKVALLLPRDSDGVPTVTQAFHGSLPEHVTWCDWTPSVAREFGLHDAQGGNGVYRKLHAKIYAGDGWQFVGSVNLSQKAMSENVEAGFLLTGTGSRKLLGKEARAERFAPRMGVEAPPADEGAVSFPAVFLVFDWLTGRLEASAPRQGTLVLHDREGVEALRMQLVGVPAHAAAGPLREQLRHSSLLRARWEQPDGCSAPRDVIVVQRQVYCRPSTLPPMSLQDLLRILQSMEPAQRAAVFGRMAVDVPRLDPDDRESLEFLPPTPDAADGPTFFAEFSQVNAAFWQLKERLKTHPAEQAYYLDGESPDSLSGIVRTIRADTSQSRSAPVIRYLTLLGVDEVLTLHGRHGGELADEVMRLIAQEEAGPAFADVPDKTKFLHWIKRMFVLPVSRMQETDAEN